MTTLRRTIIVLLLGCAGFVLAGTTSYASPAPDELAAAYGRMVRQQLSLPPNEIRYYAARTARMLRDAGVFLIAPQYVAVVDRDPHVQAILVFWLDPAAASRLIGASPVSTGRTGQFDHFETPIGVFEHSMANPDFRAEGTKNKFGIRGYGRKGMRVFDFGWQQATRGWGNGGPGVMRLQMHATDPDLLESRLGQVQSKGCIRIPSGLNSFLDYFGVLDADYEIAANAGESLWVLSPNRTPAAGAGRYLVILDSARTVRPAWSRPR
jgi:hypothetical protein